jgi:predicted nucleic acid-binding protein
LILVDTSVWINFLNSAYDAAGDELERLIRDGAPLVLTGVVVAEILQGLTRNVPAIASLLERWPLIEPGGIATYEAAAEIYRSARMRGITLTTTETVIAAVCLEHGAELFTLDRDFQRLTFVPVRLYGGFRK